MTGLDGAGIEEKVAAGQRLSREEGLQLMETPDLLWVGQLADRARQRQVGEACYYAINLNLNYSNACVLDCKFCGFYRPLGHAEAYTRSLDEIENTVRRYAAQGLMEVHIVGGLNPKLPLEYFEEMLQRIKQVDLALHIKCFTVVEVEFYAKVNRVSVDTLLARLRDAGLGMLTGGGAEILASRVRKIICPHKCSGERWVELMRLAHRLGVPANATMLYGHVETVEERVDHLLALRALQDETAGFQAFVPLPFHAEGTALQRLHPASAWEDLRVIAVSRLLLDNVRHIKALWTYLGERMGQLALRFGADDLGGINADERIVHAAGARTATELPVERMVQLIRDAQRVPVRADNTYGAEPVLEVPLSPLRGEGRVRGCWGEAGPAEPARRKGGLPPSERGGGG